MDKMNASVLCGKKEAMVNEWEECFEMSVNDVLSDEGIAKLWDQKTSVEEAEAILTGAAINVFIDDIFDDMINDAAIIIMGGKKKVESGDKKGANKPFRIVRKKDNNFFDLEFETEQEAKDYIEESVRHSTYTIDDFMIVKVM